MLGGGGRVIRPRFNVLSNQMVKKFHAKILRKYYGIYFACIFYGNLNISLLKKAKKATNI
jgi:hypothetical protein